MPSRAMLTTPARSENRPPSDARINGVDSRIVDQMSETVKSSTMGRNRPGPAAKPGERIAEHRLARDEENDDGLQNLHDVFRDVLRERVHRNAAAREHRKEERRKHDTHRMVAAEQRHRDA